MPSPPRTLAAPNHVVCIATLRHWRRPTHIHPSQGQSAGHLPGCTTAHCPPALPAPAGSSVSPPFACSRPSSDPTPPTLSSATKANGNTSKRQRPTTPPASPAPASRPGLHPPSGTPAPQGYKMHFSNGADAPQSQSPPARQCTSPIGAMYPPTGTRANTNRLQQSGEIPPFQLRITPCPPMPSKSRFLYTSMTSSRNRKIPRPERGGLRTPPHASCCQDYSLVPRPPGAAATPLALPPDRHPVPGVNNRQVSSATRTGPPRRIIAWARCLLQDIGAFTSQKGTRPTIFGTGPYPEVLATTGFRRDFFHMFRVQKGLRVPKREVFQIPVHGYHMVIGLRSNSGPSPRMSRPSTLATTSLPMPATSPQGRPRDVSVRGMSVSPPAPSPTACRHPADALEAPGLTGDDEQGSRAPSLTKSPPLPASPPDPPTVNRSRTASPTAPPTPPREPTPCALLSQPTARIPSASKPPARPLS